MIPPVFAFVGRSNCGKTTLLEKVVAVLTVRGYRVGVVKHTRHRNVALDALGTDTRRFWDAGAAHVTLVSPARVTHAHRYAVEPEVTAILDAVRDVDVVVLEGYKATSLPKIEVVRAARDPLPLPGLVNRIAFVTDVAALGGMCPCFALDQVEAVADFLVSRMDG